EGLRSTIGPRSGIKRTFGYAYHAPDCEHVPTQANQFGNVWRDENHLFRQDVDAHLLHVAIRYGARALQGVRVQKLNTDDRQVVLETTAGTITADYVVDGTGFRSVVADTYGLRETPARFKHHSRTIFTHMLDVKPFEE